MASLSRHVVLTMFEPSWCITCEFIRVGDVSKYDHAHGTLQLPRLTQMLRASVLGGQNDVDISELYRRRANALRDRAGVSVVQVKTLP